MMLFRSNWDIRIHSKENFSASELFLVVNKQIITLLPRMSLISAIGFMRYILANPYEVFLSQKKIVH